MPPPVYMRQGNLARSPPRGDSWESMQLSIELTIARVWSALIDLSLVMEKLRQIPIMLDQVTLLLSAPTSADTRSGQLHALGILARAVQALTGDVPSHRSLSKPYKRPLCEVQRAWEDYVFHVTLTITQGTASNTIHKLDGAPLLIAQLKQASDLLRNGEQFNPNMRLGIAQMLSAILGVLSVWFPLDTHIASGDLGSWRSGARHAKPWLGFGDLIASVEKISK